jgi:hypothetical protein
LLIPFSSMAIKMHMLGVLSCSKKRPSTQNENRKVRSYRYQTTLSNE